MSFTELPLEWIAAGLIALVIVIAVLRLSQPRDSHRRRSHRSVDEDAAQSSDHRILAQAASEMRGAVQRQADQLAALRTFWSQRLDSLEAKIDSLSTAAKQAGDAGRDDGRAAVSYAPPQHSGHGADSLWPPAIPAVPSWSAGPADQAVEIRDGALVRSRSLPPAAYVSPSGGGQARVYLNADVQMTEISLPKWEAFFDLQGGRTYTAYRTTRPAEVRWDEGEGRGDLISKGLAEAI
jgi:hypothetical protein